MKVIIAGSRDIEDMALLEKAIEAAGFEITEVVSGCARGVDCLGEIWADRHNLPIRYFQADWDGLGKAAGPIRNEKMAEYADALICVHNGSKGSADMIRRAVTHGLAITELRVFVDKEPEVWHHGYVDGKYSGTIPE